MYKGRAKVVESGELMEEGGARGCSMISWARGHVLGKSSVHVHPTKQSAAALEFPCEEFSCV